MPADAKPVFKDANAETIKRKKELDEYKAEHEAFEKYINDPARRAPGWSKVDAVPDGDLWDINVDQDRVIVVGSEATVAISADSGKTFKTASIFARNPTQLVAKIAGRGDHRAAIGFENDLIRFSKDHGETWDTPSLDSGEPSALAAAGNDFYITFADSIQQSRDGGATWKSVRALTNGELSTLVASASVIYAGGKVASQAAIIASGDRGRTWRAIRLPKSAVGVWALAVGRDGSLYGSFGTDPETETSRATAHAISRSTDQGQSWTQIPVKFLGDADEIDNNWWSADEIWIGPDNTIYVGIAGRSTTGVEASTDGGRTWRRELGFTAKKMEFSKTAVYAIGHHGEVWIKTL